MSERPFRCSKCGNWYTPVPPAEGVVCFMCDSGSHAPHQKTGVIDCHFGHKSATPSEVKMAELLALCERAQRQAQGAESRIMGSHTRKQADDIVAEAEKVFAQAELAQGDMANIITWASVMELPGMKGERATARFKNIDAIEDLVANNRRPPEDLQTLRRSDKICREMAVEVAGVMADARIALGRMRATSWTEPEPKREARPRRAYTKKLAAAR